MSSDTNQQDWDEFVAEQHSQWSWRCSCGKSSVFAHDKDRAQKRANGHQTQCTSNGVTEVVPDDG